MNKYTIMGSHPGDGSVQMADCPLIAAAKHFRLDEDSQDEKKTLNIIIKDLRERFKDTDTQIGDYEVKKHGDI